MQKDAYTGVPKRVLLQCKLNFVHHAAKAWCMVQAVIYYIGGRNDMAFSCHKAALHRASIANKDVAMLVLAYAQCSPIAHMG